MQQVEAARVLKSLVEGRNPSTGEELPADSVFQQATVLRALYIGHQALESVLERGKRRALLPERVGATWDEQEDQRLRDAITAGKALSEIASLHLRTPNAILARLERLGITKPSERTTYLRFAPEGAAGQNEGSES
jgi:hypothetical protein